MKNKAKLFSLIPALWASLFDTVITISSQSQEYWNGNLDAANERNPIGNFMMQSHASGIFVICGVWIILIVILGYFMPRKYSRVFLLFVLIAHSFGVANWLLLKYGFGAAMFFILCNAILFFQIEDSVSKQETETLT